MIHPFPMGSGLDILSNYAHCAKVQKYNRAKYMWCYLTPIRPLAHTSFTYRKLNMDGFSVLNGFLGYVDSTQKIFLKFLHAQGLFQTS